ncbi:Multidrug resistance-associated protein 1 [Entophlyctis luteolus]|nr:Multidrug resistance-associated protein 1 [Entophlyctis luteolus]
MESIRISLVYQALAATVWQLQPFFIALSCFGTYVIILGNSLTPQKTFSTLALLGLMNRPMNWLRNLFIALKKIMVSARRIDAFLKAEEIQNVVTDSFSSEGYVRIANADSFHDEENVYSVIVRDARAVWSSYDTFSCRIENLSVGNGELLTLVGRTGEGKSSLIAMLLGEMRLQSGLVKVIGKIAFVSQQAWILSGTVRENILFGQKFNETKYTTILQASALEHDLEIFPAGDMTEIGERGVNLSGGQRQRISLARAIYSGADVFIFDDPLSALDAHVGKHIFNHVIQDNGILAGKTRILVTHGIQHLLGLKRILVVGDGTIIEEGSYSELIHSDGVFANMVEVVKSDQTKMKDAEKTSLEQSSVGKLDTIETLQKSEAITNVSSPNAGMLISEEEQVEGSAGWEVYKQYAEAFSVSGLALCLLLSLMSNGLSICANWWLGVWSNDNPENQTAKISFYFGVYSAIMIVVADLRAATVLHDRILQSVMRAPMSFFDSTPTGRILNRFSKDVDTLCDSLPVSFSDALLEFVIIITGFAACTIATPLFIFLVFPLAFPYVWLQKHYLGTSRDLRRLHSITRSPIYQLLEECLDGLPTLRSYGVQEAFVDRLVDMVDLNNNAWITNMYSSRWFDVRIDIVGLMSLFISAALCVASKGYVDPRLAGLALIYASANAGYLSFFVQDFCLMEVNIVSVERINEYVDCEQEPSGNAGAHERPLIWPTKGALDFKKYSARYRPGMDLVLRNLDFHVNPGERVGIVGRTGSGKSTLVLGLTRVLESAGGSIELDGIDVATVELQDLRQHITVVPQEPVLFATTVRRNLDPFGRFEDAELWGCLEKVQMKEWALERPMKLDSSISERGGNLSVGDRQLICMARALLHKSRVLVLDEGESSKLCPNELAADSMLSARSEAELVWADAASGDGGPSAAAIHQSMSFEVLPRHSDLADDHTTDLRDDAFLYDDPNAIDIWAASWEDDGTRAWSPIGWQGVADDSDGFSWDGDSNSGDLVLEPSGSSAVDYGDAASVFAGWGGSDRRTEYLRDVLSVDVEAGAAAEFNGDSDNFGLDSSVQQSVAITESDRPRRAFRVLIVGAGIGALSLAQALKKVGIASRVLVQPDDAFGAGWSDHDRRLLHRTSLPPDCLNALRHCLPMQNFRALVYHQSTLLPADPPVLSFIPYIGRYLTAFFYGIRSHSPFSRPGIYTSRYLITLLFPGLLPSPVHTHLFGKTKLSNSSSQSLSVTLKTLRAVLLAGLDVITPGLPAPNGQSSGTIPYQYFSTYASSYRTHDAEFGIASVWNHGKSVVRVAPIPENAQSSPEYDGAKTAVYFEDGSFETGDLVVDLREDLVAPQSNNGLYPIDPEKATSSMIPAKILANAGIIRSNAQAVMYTAPKHIVPATGVNQEVPQIPTPPGSTVGSSYTLPSRTPSRRISYAIAPAIGPRTSSRGMGNPVDGISLGTTSQQPIPSPLSQDAVAYATPGPRKPLRRPSTRRGSHESLLALVPVVGSPAKGPQHSMEEAEGTKAWGGVAKKSSRDSITAVATNGNSGGGSPTYKPLNRFRRRAPSFMSTRSRAGSLRRFGSIAGSVRSTGSRQTMALNATQDLVALERPTHVHWRLCFPDKLLATHTTAMFLTRGIPAKGKGNPSNSLRERVVTAASSRVVETIAREIVGSWHDGLRRCVAGSVGVAIGVDAFGGFGNRGVGNLNISKEVENLFVEFKAGPTSLKPFDSPHDINIALLISRVRDLSLTLEKACAVAELGLAPQIQSEERLQYLLGLYRTQSSQIEQRAALIASAGVQADLASSEWFGLMGGILTGMVRALYASVAWIFV